MDLEMRDHQIINAEDIKIVDYIHHDLGPKHLPF